MFVLPVVFWRRFLATKTQVGGALEATGPCKMNGRAQRHFKRQLQLGALPLRNGKITFSKNHVGLNSARTRLARPDKTRERVKCRAGAKVAILLPSSKRASGGVVSAQPARLLHQLD